MSAWFETAGMMLASVGIATSIVVIITCVSAIIHREWL